MNHRAMKHGIGEWLLMAVFLFSAPWLLSYASSSARPVIWHEHTRNE